MTAFHFFTTAELRAVGHTVPSIREAIEAGRLERVIRGWYCDPEASRVAVRAMRRGGRVSCVSALGLHGAWVPPDQGEHVGFPSHASGRRLALRGAPDTTVAHWHPKAARTGSDFAVTPLTRAVEDLLVCQPQHFAVAVLDSLLHRRIIARNRLEAIVRSGPFRMRSLAEHLEPRSEEGIESIVRFLLEAAGICCDVQVVMRSGSRVDLLIDGWLVIEVDGRAPHTAAGSFTADRVREATLMRDGRLVLRFAYATVIYNWPFVLETIRSVMTQHAPVR